MKTQALKTAVFVKSLVLAFSLMSAIGFSQSCPFVVTNNLSCDIIITYESVGPTCNAICASTATITGSGGTFTLPGGCCGPGIGDIYVGVTYIWSGTNFVSTFPTQGVNGNLSCNCTSCPIPASNNNAFPTGVSCLPNTDYSLTWSATGVLIN